MFRLFRFWAENHQILLLINITIYIAKVMRILGLWPELSATSD